MTDATTTSGIEGPPGAEQIIDRTERVLREREFAAIATTDTVVATLTGS